MGIAFMETDSRPTEVDKDEENAYQGAVCEGVISLWKINAQGQLMKDMEKSFTYPITKERELQIFRETKEGQMKL